MQSATRTCRPPAYRNSCGSRDQRERQPFAKLRASGSLRPKSSQIAAAGIATARRHIGYVGVTVSTWRLYLDHGVLGCYPPDCVTDKLVRVLNSLTTQTR